MEKFTVNNIVTNEKFTFFPGSKEVLCITTETSETQIMNLYLLTQNTVCGYDTYSSCVVAAAEGITEGVIISSFHAG